MTLTSCCRSRSDAESIGFAGDNESGLRLVAHARRASIIEQRPGVIQTASLSWVHRSRGTPWRVGHKVFELERSLATDPVSFRQDDRVLSPPITAFWSTLLGRKRLYLRSITTFIVGSILAGTLRHSAKCSCIGSSKVRAAAR